MNPVVRLQLVLQAELLATAIALIGLLPCVDALVALESALIPEAAAAELTLIWVVTCENNGLAQTLASSCLCSRGHTAGYIPCPAVAYVHHLTDPTTHTASPYVHTSRLTGAPQSSTGNSQSQEKKACLAQPRAPALRKQAPGRVEQSLGLHYLFSVSSGSRPRTTLA